MRIILDGWAIDDEYPSHRIEDIPRLSARAHSYFARNADPATTVEGVMSILGAITMINGMEYHFDNYLCEQEAIKDSPRVELENLVHEAVAFLNRMGQFASFVRSSFASRAIKDMPAIAPNIQRLMIFRNKHAAHRSLDMPRGEPLGTRISHQLGMFPGLFSPRPGARPVHFEDGEVVDMAKHRRFMLTDYYLSFQMMDNQSTSAEQFNVELDAPKVLVEAYSVIEAVVSFR